MRLTARAPATSANLGPGFDCFGLALDLCNEVTVDTDLEPGVSWEGEGADELPTDGTDIVTRAMARAAEAAGATLPRFALHGVNRIPLQRGLGSSSAARVAGVALASRLLGLDPDPSRMLRLASSLEGHGDNAAAAIFGGLTLAFSDRDAVRLEPHPSLRPVALVPNHTTVSTEAARAALPSSTSLSDASFNAGRSALALLALTQRPDLLADALQDRLHQQVRLELAPDAGELFRSLKGNGVPVCVSGSGPTLLAFETDDRPVPEPGEGWRALRLTVRGLGVEILEG
jgi:homoserine kinase